MAQRTKQANDASDIYSGEVGFESRPTHR